jgi:hypothetical protein
VTGVYQQLVPTWAPPWMQQENGRIFLEAFGAELDARAAAMLWARLQANPFAGGPTASREGAARLADGRLIECDAWVLPLHAAQRGITLYPTESELSKRIRIASWWKLHAHRGTHRGELEHVFPYFADRPASPTIWILHRSGSGVTVRHKMDPSGAYSVTRDGADFDFDGNTAKRSRWWAFLDMTGTGFTEPERYGTGRRYGDGGIYGEGGADPFTAARKADVIAMLREWKSASSRLAGVALFWGSSAFDPTSATPVQDATGWWSMPAGHWGRLVVNDGRASRPPGLVWIHEDRG